MKRLPPGKDATAYRNPDNNLKAKQRWVSLGSEECWATYANNGDAALFEWIRMFWAERPYWEGYPVI